LDEIKAMGKQYCRAPSHPLPTVQQVEDALDKLINAFVAHGPTTIMKQEGGIAAATRSHVGKRGETTR
jgi:hypothetical protein